MNDWYTLAEDGKTPILAPDYRTDPQGYKDAMWRDNHPGWIVGKTPVGDAEVSTVFLFLDHRSSYFDDPDTPPVLWETLVFGGPLSDECDRYTSWDDAKAGHDAMVERVRAVTADMRAETV